MLSRCHFCHDPLPENRTLERFPVGRRVAYDPWRGRLWAVCPSCGRWTLAPFETRWEVLEDLERITRDSARLLSETENIGLLKAGDLEIVRVGKARLREESWWRYGDEFAARRERAGRAARRGKVWDLIIFFAISGIPYWGHSKPEKWIERARHRRFGRTLWEGSTRCPGCGAVQRNLRFGEVGQLRLETAGDGEIALRSPCPRCRQPGGTGHHLRGVSAEQVLRRALAFQHFAGATESAVGDAMSAVEQHVSTADVVLELAERRQTLRQLSAPISLALEIALNADVEERLLRMEVEELEAHWREAEMIAAIADGVLTPPPR